MVEKFQLLHADRSAEDNPKLSYCRGDGDAFQCGEALM